ASLILSGFAAWGAWAGGGPFAGATLDESVLPLVLFMATVSVVSLVLGAEAASQNRLAAQLRIAEQNLCALADEIDAHRRAEADLQQVRDDLVRTVHERTATLKKATDILQTEIGQRKRVEEALMLDIAERRKAQEALMESEWRFRMFIQGVTDY